MQCPYCKGSNFYEDDNGYFNCTICGTQSQDLFSESFETEQCNPLLLSLSLLPPLPLAPPLLPNIYYYHLFLLDLLVSGKIIGRINPKVIFYLLFISIFLFYCF